jgi:hypothetical protein
MAFDRLLRKLGIKPFAGLFIDYPRDFAVRWAGGKPSAKHVLSLIEAKREQQ